jgi:hypothetical protein
VVGNDITRHQAPQRIENRLWKGLGPVDERRFAYHVEHLPNVRF